jgi:hypothetical protein
MEEKAKDETSTEQVESRTLLPRNIIIFMFLVLISVRG